MSITTNSLCYCGAVANHFDGLRWFCGKHYQKPDLPPFPEPVTLTEWTQATDPIVNLRRVQALEQIISTLENRIKSLELTLTDWSGGQ